jgi:RNA polymerase sigma-70 factor (ECF subfamily)
LGAPLPDTTWVQPMPDHRTINADPAEITAQRASVRMAFVAALQYLPARQRAVLILRDVLQWKANEVAQLLDSSVASVNSALQRARSTLATREVSTADTFEPTDDRQRALLARYVDAFERHDIKALTSLLHEDATMSMPPFAWWLRGRGQIADAMLHADSPCRDSRFVATAANGVPAYGQYVPTGPDGSYQPWALVMIDIVGDRIAGLSSFLNAGQLFPLFDLPSLGPAVSVGCSA